MAGETIGIEDFAKIDLRVGRIVSAERIRGTRLIKLLVDLGELGERQIIAGIGEFYGPEDIVGKNVVVVANLKPKRIRGYVSEGMILAAGCDKGERIWLVVVEGEPRPGSRVC